MMDLLPINDPAGARNFLLDKVIQARTSLPENGDSDPDDADVHVYLAGLLAQILPSERHDELALGYIFDYDFELADALDGADGARTFRTLKTNADNILVALGIFRALPTPRVRQKGFVTRDDYVGRGRSYYTQAASCRKRIDRQTTARVEVLEKLSDRFETYLQLLDRLRADYLDLHTRLSSGTLFHLEHDASEAARTFALGRAVDALLDAWSSWQSGQGTELAVSDALAVVHALDPQFAWPPPSPLDPGALS